MDLGKEISLFLNPVIQVGDTVLVKASGMLGVVLEQSGKHKDLVYVRVWDHRLKLYDEIVRCKSELAHATREEFTKRAVPGDPVKDHTYKELALELAFITEDKGWFNEVCGRSKQGGVTHGNEH